MNAAVVVERDVRAGAQSLPQLLVSVELLAVDVFAFHRMEERFHVGVVVDLARPVHALGEALARHDGAVGMRGIFDPPIAMEHQARPWIAFAQRLEQRGMCELDVASRIQAPTQDAACWSGRASSTSRSQFGMLLKKRLCPALERPCWPADLPLI